MESSLNRDRGPDQDNADPSGRRAFFAATGEADQPSSFAGHRSRAHRAAANGDLDVLLRDIWI
jgi:hypothetical protein